MTPPLDTVGIVVVNWNGGDLTLQCLASVMHYGIDPARVTVVDNGSTDGSVDRIIESHPEIGLIRNATNRGYAAACNQGMRAVLEDGRDFVFLLNNDARMEPGCLEALLEAAHRMPHAGLLAGKILLADGRIWCAGVDVGFFPNLQRLRGFEKVDDGGYDTEEALTALTGCGLLVRREVLEQVGYFDEDYFVYVEDIDLSKRVRAAGWTCLYVPGAVMIHDASQATGGGYNARRKYMVAYNVVVYLKKHGTAGLWLAFALFELLLWPLVLMVGILSGRGEAALAKGRGTWAALFGRPMARP